MVKESVFFLFFISIASSKTCNKSHSDYIIWSENKYIKWTDFQATRPVNPKFTAISSVQLSFDYEIDVSLKKYRVDCLFFKSQSWFINQSEYLLSHEQRHFDIGEIQARCLRKELTQIKADNRKVTDKFLISVFNIYTNALLIMQNEYDSETNHATNQVQQKSWDLKIGKMLDSLQDYKK